MQSLLSGCEVTFQNGQTLILLVGSRFCFDQSAILAPNRGQLVVNGIESFLPLLIVSGLRHIIRCGNFHVARQKIVILFLLQLSQDLLAFGQSPLREEQVGYPSIDVVYGVFNESEDTVTGPAGGVVNRLAGSVLVIEVGDNLIFV